MQANLQEQTIELNSANFPEVVELSREVPLLVDFWADWCAPCRQIAPVLEKLASELRGRFRLVKVNADQEPLVTQQFGVRGLPTLKVVWQGQLVGELVGAQSEGAIRNLIQPFLLEADDSQIPSGDADGVNEAIQGGRLEEAIAVLTDRLSGDPADSRSRTRLVELLISEGRLDEAESVLDQAPSECAVQMRRQRALLAFARRSSSLPSLESLENQLQAMSDQADLELVFAYSLRLVATNRLEQGLDGLLAILRRDKAYAGGAARKALLEILDMLGRDDPLSADYRRRLANIFL